MSELLEQVKRVAAARTAYEQAADTVAASRAEWEKQAAELIVAVALAKGAQSDAETLLRDMAVSAFQQTGEKAPAPGVGIRETKKYSWDEATALAWARETGLALKLDAKALEKVASVSPLPFVTIATVPTATIATDLDAVLAEAAGVA